jgi:hypothetical protein
LQAKVSGTQPPAQKRLRMEPDTFAQPDTYMQKISLPAEAKITKE